LVLVLDLDFVLTLNFILALDLVLAMSFIFRHNVSLGPVLTLDYGLQLGLDHVIVICVVFGLVLSFFVGL
jgi:hypothetical protein